MKNRFLHFSRNDNKGLTLIETLLAVALMVVLFGLSAVFYQSFQVKNDLDVAANTIAQTLRRAQVISQAGEADSEWGVDIRTGSITLFKGTDYATRDPDDDEVFTVPSSINLSVNPDKEIVFEKLTGDLLPPDTAFTITMTTPIGDNATITVNKKGMVSY